MRQLTNPTSILLQEIQILKDIKRHMDSVEKGTLVLKGQEAVTTMRLAKQRERIYKMIEDMSAI